MYSNTEGWQDASPAQLRGACGTRRGREAPNFWLSSRIVAGWSVLDNGHAGYSLARPSLFLLGFDEGEVFADRAGMGSIEAEWPGRSLRRNR